MGWVPIVTESGPVHPDAPSVAAAFFEEPNGPPPLSFDRVRRVVCNYYGVQWEKIHSHNNATTLARPRFMVQLLAHDMLHMSLPVIGRLMDRDHTSILHGVKEARKRIETRDEWRVDHVEIRRRLAE